MRCGEPQEAALVHAERPIDQCFTLLVWSDRVNLMRSDLPHVPCSPWSTLTRHSSLAYGAVEAHTFHIITPHQPPLNPFVERRE